MQEPAKEVKAKYQKAINDLAPVLGENKIVRVRWPIELVVQRSHVLRFFRGINLFVGHLPMTPTCHLFWTSPPNVCRGCITWK